MGIRATRTVDVQCPIHGCEKTRGPFQVMCRQHWLRVPKDLRRTVWDLYRKSPGSAGRLRAIRESIRIVNEKVSGGVG